MTISSPVAQAKAKPTMLGWFVGPARKASGGKANPQALNDILAAGQRILVDGGSALDAVTEAVRLLEECPLFNAGKGAVLTSAGTYELDASIMDGTTYVSMSGTGRIERSVAKKQELWNRIQEAYAGDAEDPSNVILEVTVETAEYWDGGSQVAALLGLAKAAVTGERPNDGEHGTVQL